MVWLPPRPFVITYPVVNLMSLKLKMYDFYVNDYFIIKMFVYNNFVVLFNTLNFSVQRNINAYLTSHVIWATCDYVLLQVCIKTTILKAIQHYIYRKMFWCTNLSNLTVKRFTITELIFNTGQIRNKCFYWSLKCRFSCQETFWDAR